MNSNIFFRANFLKYFGIFALAIILTVIVSSFSANNSERWEYQMIHLDTNDLQADQKKLNSLGDEGWELVAVTIKDGGARSYEKLFTFKRKAN